MVRGAPRLLILGVFRRGLLGEGSARVEDGLLSHLQTVCDALRPGVAASAALVDLDQATAATELELQPRSDAVAMVALTACPTELLEHFVGRAKNLPFVLLAPRLSPSWDGDYGLREHLAGSGQVGAAMIASLLARNGVRYLTHVTGPRFDSDATTLDVLRSAATAGRLRCLRLLRVDGPHAGYTHMELPEGGGSQGEREMQVAEVRLADVWPSAAADPPFVLSDGVPALAGFEVADASLRNERELAAALVRHCGENGIDAVAINSTRIHAATRGSSQPVSGKLALSILGAQGLPCSDTGDLLSAVALFVGKRLAGAALYCEVNATGAAGGWQCSTTGEADLRWLCVRPDARATLLRGQDLHEDAWTLKLDIGAGPATLLGIAVVGSFDQVPALRFITVEGDALPIDGVGLPRTAFSFRFASDGDADALFARWLDCGANHHACLIHGRVAAALNRVARLAGCLSVTF